MKKIWLIFLAAALTACTQASVENGSVLALGEGWTLTGTIGEDSFDAVVPSTVAGTIYASGFYGDDLFVGRNYEKVDKTVFDDEWVYETEFTAKPAKGQHSELVFDGMNYRADIFLNGTQIAASDTTYGVFIRRSYDVEQLLAGRNRLEVRLRRALPGDLNIGFVDWNPRPLDESMGIVRPVSLHTTGAVSIEDVFVIPDLKVPQCEEADLEIRVKLRNKEDHPVTAALKLDLQDAGAFQAQAELPADAVTTVTLTPAEAAQLHLDHPRVWWTWELGTPELYQLTVDVEADGALSDTRNVCFGVRKIESRLTGKNYRQFTLNGRDVLIKGAGWTDDIFLLDTPESLAQQVQYVKDMNLNCIRFENIWGKDDTVYDLCDREGLLALVGWSCQWEWEDYCGLPETRGYGCINDPVSEDLAVRYFHDQVVRLHNHPSVSAWMTGSDRIPNPGLEERYLEIYRQEDYRPYVNSAKNLFSTVSGWSGTKMEGPYDYVAPDYWYFDTEHGGAFGFNTETGIGANLPQMESLRRMIPGNQLWPLSDAWNYHCTASSSVMNTVDNLVATVTAQYGAPENLVDFVRKAHALDYAGTRGMFEAFRAKMPEATGIVQWMLNSAWPSLYWQLYDWYGVPTAAYYGVKKACEPEQLMFNYKDRQVYLVNECMKCGDMTAYVQVFDADSRVIGQEYKSVMARYHSVVPVFDLRKYDGKPHFIALMLTATDGSVVAHNFYAVGAADNVYDFDKSTWYDTPVRKWTDLRFVFAKGQADVDMKVEPVEDGYAVTLENRSDFIVPQAIVKALDQDGQLAVPAFWSDNFCPLLPGGSVTLVCKTKQKDLHFVLEQ